MRRVPFAAIALATSALASRPANAQVIDRFWLQGEGGADRIVAGSNASRFNWGGRAMARLGIRIVGPLSVQLSVGNWWFVANNGPAGRLTTFEAGFRGWFRLGRGPIGGPWADANAAYAITGDLTRFAFDAAIGWDFVPVEWLALGPVVRLTYVVQAPDLPQPDSAPVLGVGLAVTLRVPRSAPAVPQPPSDMDHDGVNDDHDQCAAVPEDRDGFRDDDGCPDPDNDGDGVPDAQDRCPDLAEVRNGFQDDDGCPDTPPPPPPPSAAPLSAAEEHMQQLSQQVLFGDATAHLRHEFRPMLSQLCTELRNDPSVVRVRVVGHADERGSDTSNLQLSVERANAVVEFLVRCGIEARRIEPAGRGESDQVCHDNTPACLQRNRRVEFIVLERGTPTP